MLIIITITAAIVLALATVYLMAWQQSRQFGTTPAQEFAGICATALDQTIRKQANLDKIIGLFSSQTPELSNFQIRQALGVSSRTVVRYMNELQEQGKVRQVGTTGTAVIYHLQ